jgi:carbon monoxide dehydrogenase subunit G
MNFEKRCTIPVARQQLWDFLMDVPTMAACVPGVEEVKAVADDQYQGRLRVKLGPISLNLQGSVAIKERDQDNWRAVAKAEAKDRRIGGGTDLTATMTLVEKNPALTELVIAAQARFMGKLGEFGEPIIRKQTDTTIAAFARNVAARFAQPQVAPTPTVAPAAAAETRPPQPPAVSARPRTYWRGKLIGLALGLFVWLVLPHLAGPTPPSPVPAYLRITSTILALVILGDLIERAIYLIRRLAKARRMQGAQPPS